MKIHVLHTGEVRVSPFLPFGGGNCNLLKASGMITPKEEWIWLPVIVAQEELDCARKNGFIRYKKKWWEGVDLQTIEWNGTEGPARKSFDLFGDGSIKMINIPGHCDGLCAVKITREDGKYVLLFSDGGYATKSWKEMITSGVSLDKEMQRKSLQWIREQSMDANCIESLATHDTDIKPHVIEL